MRTFEIRMKFWIIFINLNYCGNDFPITFQLWINKNICPRLCQCKKKTSRIHSDGCSEFVWSCSDRKLIENKAGTVLLIFVRLPGAFVCVHSIFNQRHWRWRMYEVIFFFKWFNLPFRQNACYLGTIQGNILLLYLFKWQMKFQQQSESRLISLFRSNRFPFKYDSYGFIFQFLLI